MLLILVNLGKPPEVGKWLGKRGSRINKHLITYTPYTCTFRIGLSKLFEFTGHQVNDNVTAAKEAAARRFALPSDTTVLSI